MTNVRMRRGSLLWCVAVAALACDRGAEGASGRVSAVERAEHVVALGRVGTDSAALLPLRRAMLASGAHGALGHGAYELRLVGASGEVLFVRRFEPRGSETVNGMRDFAETLPWAPGTVRVEVVRDGRVLAAREASAARPSIAVRFPNGGEHLSGTTTIRWDASDADHDPLLFDVLYSVDDGATWRALAEGLSASETEWNTDLVAGTSEARVRVMATDGLNVASDDSDAAFSVAAKVPQVSITTPENGARRFLGEPLVLGGAAFDPEDGVVPEAALTWSIDGDRSHPRLRRLTLTQLGTGPHLVLLEAMDRDRNVGRASIEIEILGPDPDGDRIVSEVDDCPNVYDPDQADRNGDGVGDACDDEDGDGFVDAIDNCPTVLNEQQDMDEDGIGDACDPTIDDVRGPDIHVPADMTVEAKSALGAHVTYEVTAVDKVDGPVAVRCTPAPGRLFPLGVSVVACSATDNAGNTTTAQFRVTVVDGRPPTIARLEADPRSLWPPNNKLRSVRVRAVATDAVSVPSCRVVTVASSPPDGHGDKEPDWSIVDATHVLLRSEKAAAGELRSYTVAVECVDAAGNAARSSVIVRVER